MAFQRLDDSDAEFDPSVEKNLYAYDDIVTTFAEGHFELDLTATNGTDLPSDGNSVSGLHIAPVLNGKLEDNMVAEVIAIELLDASVWFDQFVGNSQGGGSGRVEYQVNLPNEKHQQSHQFGVASGDIDQNLGNIGTADAADFGPDTGAFSRTYAGSATALLYQTLPFTVPAWESTNGWAHGGAVTHSGPYMKNYRDNFGRGPVVDPGDEFQIGLGVEWTTNDSVNIKGEIKVATHYDVYEQPMGDYQDVRGLGESEM